MTSLEMQTRVWERLEESDSDPSRYSAADVLEYLNDAVQHLVSRAGLFVTTATLTQQAETLFADLPTDCIAVESLARDTGPWFLDPTTPYELDRGTRDDANPRWPAQHAVGSRAYFPFGLDEVALWPFSSAGGDTYTLTYRQDAGVTTLVAAGDEPSVPADYHDALVDYAVARCLIVDGALSEAGRRMALFKQAVTSAKARSEAVGRAWEKGRGIVLK